MSWTVRVRRWRWPSGAVITAYSDALGDADRPVVPRDNRVLGHHPDYALECVVMFGAPKLHRACFLDTRERVPIEPGCGGEGRQGRTAVARVERDMRLGDLDQGIDRRLGRYAARREVMLQRPGRPRLRRVRENDDPQLRMRHNFSYRRGRANQ